MVGSPAMAKSSLTGPWPIRTLFERLSVDLSPDAERQLRSWLDALAAWNQKMDLTAARSREELVDLMIADAAHLATRVRGESVVDVGTGAGAPGLALALLRPDLRITLVEPLAKRISFLRAALATLQREDVRLHHGRGEDVAEKFDIAISRATLAPAAWLDLGERLATHEVWVFLAKEEAPTGNAMTLAETVGYRWPLTSADRTLVRYAREGA